MDVQVLPKPATKLIATRLLQQTSFWGKVKSRLGWIAFACDIRVDGIPSGDLLLLRRNVSPGISIAYAPFGPESLPDSDQRGLYLSALSSELRELLGPSCMFIRWDLPWESPYSEDKDRFDAKGNWLGPPETRLRELRMNWGLDNSAVHKAPTDILPPDTMIIDLNIEESEILAAMKPKTRYNTLLSFRRGVHVRHGKASDLDIWMKLYEQTARRNAIAYNDRRFFEALLVQHCHDAAVHLLIAEKQNLPLAAMFLSISADRATYLYGASSNEGRNLMAPYALQWTAIKESKRHGCRSYDLFGVAPGPNPDHPLYGLYRFKAGFGGKMIHRQGSWDYPYDYHSYEYYIAQESTAKGFHL
ncbi:MAG TPA: peptidoglycan bridge formation glycyltransferase FemA/FemB family protein [Rectinema sp.]|nr:peptidoglycan bridge formation glycyltransferase FemA/FemB family protein [Rectinema sp.]HPB62073.1 peptidoglycan bridge formation glycyltransferase FemA/FemB family protein [Rectinema sp.]HQQ31899.1 peptidoglycan bridge formation glycyltransferase FemA/FemB family protein [Rectinema sp.]